MARRVWTRDPTALAIVALTAARWTTLLTSDDLPPVETARQWAETRLPEQWAHGVRCPHCLGFWCSLAAVAATETAHRHGHGRRWLLACLPWAISSVVGQLADRQVA